VSKVIRVLERGEVVGRDASDLVRLRTTELRQALSRYPEAAVEAHIHQMSRAYLLAFPTEALIRHFALMADPLEPSHVRAHWSLSDAPGVYDLVVVARDRPGLFSKVSGALALHGVNVLSAQVFTRVDGVALEAFSVEGAHDREIEDARRQRVETDLSKALAGRISLDVRLAEKRDAYSRPSKGKREPARVVVDNRVTDFYTVVEVHAPDHVGLLAQVASTFADLGVDVRTAKVSTLGDRVVDVFYVHDAAGNKITKQLALDQLKATLIARLTSEYWLPEPA
jgi:[protein-PII] uridylyltransferase